MGKPEIKPSVAANPETAATPNDRTGGAAMITRRHLVFAAVLTVACAPAGAARAAEAAKAFLGTIYAAYKGKNSKGIPLDSDAMLRLYFEPGLAALLIADRKAAAKKKTLPRSTAIPSSAGRIGRSVRSTSR
jgi:hypothetical protein